VTRHTRDTHIHAPCSMPHAPCPMLAGGWAAGPMPHGRPVPPSTDQVPVNIRKQWVRSNVFITLQLLLQVARSPSYSHSVLGSARTRRLSPLATLRLSLLLSHVAMHAVRLAHPVSMSNRYLRSGNFCIVCRSIPTCLWSVHARVTKFKFANLWIKCSPDAVSTTPLTWPFSSRNAASSNSFCMSPRPKNPLSNHISHAPCPCTYTRHPGALTNRRPCAHCCSLTRLSPAPRATLALRRQPLPCPRTS
jgi:hypothetical protein